MAETIRPGDKIDQSQIKQNVNVQESVLISETQKSSLPDTLTSILPKNPAFSIVEGELFQVVIFALINKSVFRILVVCECWYHGLPNWLDFL